MWQISRSKLCPFFFFFNDTATTEIYTLSLHDALPIFAIGNALGQFQNTVTSGIISGYGRDVTASDGSGDASDLNDLRSEEHTSELQSRQYLVCRLLLEKKKNTVKPLSLRPSSDTKHIK